MATAAAAGAGALGLGAIVTVAATSAAADVTGLVMASLLATIGFFVIPARRAKAKADMRAKLTDVRARLATALRQQFASEIDRSGARIRDAVGPYSRFIRAEGEKLQQADAELTTIGQGIGDLRARAEALSSARRDPSRTGSAEPSRSAVSPGLRLRPTRNRCRSQARRHSSPAAASGIGLAIAKTLIARRRPRRDHRPRPGAAGGGGAQPSARTPSRPTSSKRGRCRRTMREVLEKFGHLDMLVNNAGVGVFKPLVDIDLASFERMFATNVTGAMLMAREAARHFVARSRGNIVNIASTRACAARQRHRLLRSKFALRGMTECWRAELRPHNVRVILVNPSEVITDFAARAGGRRRTNAPSCAARTSPRRSRRRSRWTIAASSRS